MICELCLSRMATQRVTEALPSGKRGEAHYCWPCYSAKSLRRRPAEAGFPRPRFTLKHIMVVAALFVIPNALAAWIMRSGLIPGSPA